MTLRKMCIIKKRTCYNVVRVNLIITVRTLGKHSPAQNKQTQISQTKNKTKEENTKIKNNDKNKTLTSVSRVSAAY